MRRLDVDEDLIRMRYAAGVRAAAIARELGCSDAVVLDRLHRMGVPKSTVAVLPIDSLVERYCGGESSRSLAVAFGVSASTIRRHLILAGVDVRDDRTRQQSDVRPCPASHTFRAYVLGLVWGDFSVEWATPRQQRIYVKSNSTHHVQFDLARLVFSSFGPVRIGGRTVRATLDPSFAFLLRKYTDVRPTFDPGSRSAAAFAAGYTDAEGSFGIYEGRARFKLDSYDGGVIRWFADWCVSIGVIARHRCVARRGDARPNNTTFNSDLWRVNVNDGASLLRLAATLEPFVRHAARREMMGAAVANVVARLRANDPPGTHP